MDVRNSLLEMPQLMAGRFKQVTLANQAICVCLSHLMVHFCECCGTLVTKVFCKRLCTLLNSISSMHC